MLRYRILLLLAAVSFLSSLTPAAAKPPANPYPYGKAEFKADEIQNVVQLLDIGDRYRDLCQARLADGTMSLVEHFGREAKCWYREATEREPSNAYASLSIGYVDLLLGQSTTAKATRQDHFTAAMSRFREALEKRPGYAQAYLYMAQVHALSGAYEQAKKNLDLILNSDIEDSQVHAWMAYVLMKMEREAEARKHVARAIELDDPSSSARWAREHQ